MGGPMLVVNVSEFRSNLQSFLGKVKSGEEMTLTSRGKAIAQIIPVADKKESAKKKLLSMRTKCVVGDVTSPLGESWEALK